MAACKVWGIVALTKVIKSPSLGMNTECPLTSLNPAWPLFLQIRVSIFSPFYGPIGSFPVMIIKAPLVSLCPCHDVIARGEVASSAIDATTHLTYPHAPCLGPI